MNPRWVVACEKIFLFREKFCYSIFSYPFFWVGVESAFALEVGTYILSRAAHTNNFKKKRFAVATQYIRTSF